MPHVIVKLWPGKSEQQKKRLAEEITEAVMSTLGYGEVSVSVSLEEVAATDWLKKVYRLTFMPSRSSLTKNPAMVPMISNDCQVCLRSHLCINT